MSSEDLSDSGSEYAPGASDEEVSGESDVSYDSNEELFNECEPIVEEGWSFMADPCKDKPPGPLPVFSDATGISGNVAQFTCPQDAFINFFDSEVIDKLCEWLNKRANEYSTLQSPLWRPVGRDEGYV